MASHTFRTCAGKRWVKEDAELADGVAIRLSKRNYVVFPVDERLNTFQDALNELNCEIAITISADVVKVIVGSMSEDAETFALDSTTSIQIVDTMSECVRQRMLSNPTPTLTRFATDWPSHDLLSTPASSAMNNDLSCGPTRLMPSSRPFKISKRSLSTMVRSRAIDACSLQT